jgi:hypothetical protein
MSIQTNDLTESKRHSSLQPLSNVNAPDVDNDPWPRSEIDKFILRNLREADLSPSPPTEPRVLVRRLYFDLHGLPPTPEEIEKFAADPSDAAYKALVDELLVSPHYGERWGRHWLDVARFGESDGFERNNPRKNFWHFRDWVIRALNDDMPYDEFARMQLAGDILKGGRDGDSAVGFLVAGVHNTVVGSSERMKRLARQDELEEIVGAVGQTFLGLTINCARCHDHKFDPILTNEYYSMIAAIDGVRHGEKDVEANENAAERNQLDQQIADLQKKLQEIDNAVRQTGLQKKIAVATTRRAALGSGGKSKVYTVAARNPGAMRVHIRGSVTNFGAQVVPAGIAVLAEVTPDFGLANNAPDRQRRSKLADWVTDPANPLFTRVIVNRVWHYHFRTGIVDTPSDLGFNGGRPSHPELLDGWRRSSRRMVNV